MITTYSRTSDELAYAMIRAVDESFDGIRDATALGAGWKLETAGVPPADAPWHPGATQYHQEKGLWHPDAQAWNEAALARLGQVTARLGRAPVSARDSQAM